MKKIASAVLAGAVILGPVAIASPAQARPVHDQPVYKGPCEGRYESVYNWKTNSKISYCNTTPRKQLAPVRRPPVWWNPWTW